MRRALAAGAGLLLVAGCGGSGSATPAAKPSARPSCVAAPPTAPAPAGATTDLTKKPAVEIPDTPPPCELQTIDLVVGKGAPAVDGSPVAVKYVGVLYANGKEFDSSWSRSPSETLPFTLGGGVIPGFSNGTKGMRVGGRREILIPSKDGYGADGSPPVIPPHAELVFVVDLMKVG